MRAKIVLCLLAALALVGGRGRPVLAQEDPSQEIRELQDPAPEAVELELTSPETPLTTRRGPGGSLPCENPSPLA